MDPEAHGSTTDGISRPELLRRVARFSTVFVVAPGGYGKTTLADEAVSLSTSTPVRVEVGDDRTDVVTLIRRLSSALRRAGLTDAAATLRSPADPPTAGEDLALVMASTEPLLFIFDGVERFLEDAAAWLGSVLDDLDDRHRVLVLGRSLPGQLGRVAARSRVGHLGEEDLRLDDAEVARLCALVRPHVNREEVQAVIGLVGGWPAAASLAASALGTGTEVDWTAKVIDSRLLRSLVESQLAQLSAEDGAALVQLAHLPLLDQGLIDLVGPPQLATRLSLAGVALRQRSDGWSTLSGPVSEQLRRMHGLDPEVAVTAAEYLSARGEVATALRMLLRAGLDEAVAAQISSSPAILSLEDPSEVVGLVEALDRRAVIRYPGALVCQSRALRVLGLQDRREEALDQALALAQDAEVDTVQRAALAERAEDLAAYEDPAAEAMARDVLAQAGPGERFTRAKAMGALGSALLRRAHLDRALVVEAGHLLEQSARLLEEEADPQAAGRTLMMAALDLHHVVGDFNAALADLDRALFLLPQRGRSRAVALALRAEVHLGAGDVTAAVADAAAAIDLGRMWRDHRALAYASWQQMEAASREGRRDDVVFWDREVSQHQGAWFDHVTGAIFLAERAVALDRVGAAGPDVIEQARSRRDQAPVNIAIAELAVAARAGEVEAGRAALVRLDAERESLQPRDAWWVALLRGAVAQAAGNDAEATEQLRRAGSLAPNTSVLGSRDPELFTRLRPLLGTDGGEDTVQLRLFGPFRVTRGGAPVAVAGRPADVVKVLALRKGRIRVDELVEEFWPDAEPGAGRQRLRNVLSRVRTALGEVVIRDGETLVLREDVDHDLRRFHGWCDHALSTGNLSAARAALALADEPLLADDLYADWAAGARSRTVARTLQLLDLLADAAIEEGEVDEAVRLLDRAAELDPFDESRIVRSAGILLTAGRRAAALSAADRAEQRLDDLGVPVPASLHAIRRRART